MSVPAGSSRLARGNLLAALHTGALLVASAALHGGTVLAPFKDVGRAAADRPAVSGGASMLAAPEGLH